MASAKSRSLLNKINHVVVVMLENRSFDHMLGFLYADSKNQSPHGKPFEGLTGNETVSDGKGRTVQVYKIQASDPYPYFMPGADPGEGYLNTNSQLFGTKTAPTPIVPATNQGFVSNFSYTLGWESKLPNMVIPGTKPSMIMGMYTPQMLPVLSGLAKGYAVSDQWYASAPTETLPNRAFVCCATSQGFVSDDNIKTCSAPSIFTALGKKSATWAVYGYDAPPLTRGSITDITDAPEANFGEFPDFQSAVKAGKLANYVFLEPKWGKDGSSQHPNYDVSQGEQFLHDVYYTLYGSSVWPNTLLIITYDEHGGCYDHVSPPENAVPPDNSAGEDGFDFKRFGLRVPAVLISPLIQSGTVYRSASATPFDHTSILSTLEARFGVSPLTKRDAAAPSVGGVLTLSKARSDDPLEGVKVPSSAKKPAFPAGPSHLQQVLAESAMNLPVSDEPGNGHHVDTPHFKTGEDALTYARQRYAKFAAMRSLQPEKPGTPPTKSRKAAAGR
ncbi:MAG: alkaline phosphatase family protein [Candidatus Korobacteraceae bacterium]